jgi:hypothetical protein
MKLWEYGAYGIYIAEQQVSAQWLGLTISCWTLPFSKHCWGLCSVEQHGCRKNTIRTENELLFQGESVFFYSTLISLVFYIYFTALHVSVLGPSSGTHIFHRIYSIDNGSVVFWYIIYHLNNISVVDRVNPMESMCAWRWS